MIEIPGKYNTAKIMTDNIDNTAISQIIDLCNKEIFKDSKIAIMPDCHAGQDCIIGTTMTISDKVIPNLVGGDIGCGMASIDLDIRIEDFSILDKIIRDNIPNGFTIHERSREKLLKEVFNIDLNKLKCVKGIQADIAFYSLGTLGGGNHFIEINEANGNRQVLTVHTGSRHLGTMIAKHYQNLAYKHCTKKYGADLTSHLIADLKAQGREKEIESAVKEYKKTITRPSKNSCYLEGELLKDYLNDMNIAQKYSAANRVVIISDILYHLTGSKEKYTNFCKNIKGKVIECIHNYIDIDNMMLRKGAISAQEGEKVIIPINMRDGIIIGEGKGNPDWNYSAPHGAGRILSRGQAKELLDLEEFEETMKDVFTTCVGQSTLDEAPMAYKPIDEIVANIQDAVDIIEIIKPVYNFKSN